VLHVVGVRTAVPPDIAGNPTGWDYVVVAADRADVLLPGADADEGRMPPVGEDPLGVVDVDDDLRAARDLDTEGRDRHGLAGDCLQRITCLDPVVVSAIEQADVVDAGVTKDQGRTACGDLSGPASGPFLVGVALGIAAVEDDRGVVGDPEPAQGCLKLFWRSTVPVARILKAVRVQVQRPGNVILLVLLRNAKVDVEEQEPTGRRGLRASAVEQLADPVRVHELFVVRQTFDWQSPIGGPFGPAALIDPDAGVAQLCQPRLQRRSVLTTIAVEGDLAAGKDPLRTQQPLDLRFINAFQPGAGESNSPGNVPASSRPPQPPTVVSGQLTDVDNREAGVDEAPAQFGSGDVRIGGALKPLRGTHRLS